MVKYKFEELKQVPLVIDAIYQSGPAKNVKYEPFHVLYRELLIKADLE